MAWHSINFADYVSSGAEKLHFLSSHPILFDENPNFDLILALFEVKKGPKYGAQGPIFYTHLKLKVPLICI